MAKHPPFRPATFAVLFYQQDGSRARSSGLATYGDLEATREQAQEAMRLLPGAAYAELHPYLEPRRYQDSSVETVWRAPDESELGNGR